jgi:hypothetical protein
MTSQRHYFFYRKLLNYASRNRAGNRPSAIKIRNDQNVYRNRCRRRRMRANLSSLNRARERFGGVAAAGSGAAQFPPRKSEQVLDIRREVDRDAEPERPRGGACARGNVNKSVFFPAGPLTVGTGLRYSNFFFLWYRAVVSLFGRCCRRHWARECSLAAGARVPIDLRAVISTRGEATSREKCQFFGVGWLGLVLLTCGAAGDRRKR